MTETFEDRVLSLVREEIHAPTLPASGPGGRRPSAPAGLALLAAAALIAGGAVVAVGDDGDGHAVRTARSTAAPAASAPVATPAAEALPYLTFGDPDGTVYRGAIQRPPTTRSTFRLAGDRDPARDVAIQPIDPLQGNGVTTAGIVGGRELSTLELASSGGRPLGVYWWTEPDGTSWAISSTAPAVPEIPDAVRGVLEHLSYADGQFSVAAPYEEFAPLQLAQQVWAVVDDSATLTARRDHTWSPDDTDGPTTTVLGHLAVLGDEGLTWRVSADLVVSLFVHTPDPNTGGVASVGFEGTVARAAALVETDAATVAGLPLLRGATPERLVVVLPDGVDTADVEVGYSSGSGMGTSGGTVGPEGWSVDLRDGVTEASVWATSGLGSSTNEGGVPECAQRVTVPPAGQPPVVVTLDLTCTR